MIDTLRRQADPADHRLGSQVVGIDLVGTKLIRDAQALQQTQGNVTHAARLLKISRKGLQLKMKELGLREGSGEKGD